MRQNPYRMAYLLVLIAALFWLPAAAPLRAQQATAGQLFSPGQLDDLVAPIALYPDPLISQVLVASTYPLELVQAHQWLQRNPGLTGVALTQAVAVQDWDASVQGLVAFPDVLNYLTEDITWTTNLGNAFLAQEADVMDAIQRMRTKAAQSGRLTTTYQQQVTQVNDSGQPVYVIQPSDPEIMYVPVYDPYYIWGPALYYPYASWYYPIHTSAIYYSGVPLRYAYGSCWRSSGWVGWNDWGWRPAWGAHSVFVNNTFIGHQHFNSNPQVRTGTSQWSHDSSHRQGVPYSTPALTQRFRPNQQTQNSNPRQLPIQQGGGGTPLAQRPNPAPMDRSLVDNRSVVRQTTPTVARNGVQSGVGGGATNDFRSAGPNRTGLAANVGRNGTPLGDGGNGTNVFRYVGPSRINPSVDVRRNGSQPDGAGAANVFRNVGQNRTLPSSAPTVTNRPAISTPVQQPTRSFEAGRQPNIVNSPVTTEPNRGMTMPQTNVQSTGPVRGASSVSGAPQTRYSQAGSQVQSGGGGGGGGRRR